LAEQAVGLGLYVSFSGILTYKTAQNLRDTAKVLPEDRILVETDAPYLAPMPMRGKSNEPAFVSHTLDVLAATRGVSRVHMAAVTSANFFRLFDKVPAPASFKVSA
jgi:TatD DNase family protein